jgi:hypothetical protein
MNCQAGKGNGESADRWGISLRALLQRQIRYFEKFARAYLAIREPAEVQPTLLAQIATIRAAIDQPQDIALALRAAQMRDPDFLSTVRETDAARVKRIKDEATDPELALLHWEAARGLALSSLLGMCPLSTQERDQLFDRLRAETQKSTDRRTIST